MNKYNKFKHPYNVDELNNMELTQLQELEDDLFHYRQKVKAVIEFNKYIELENLKDEEND